MFLSALAHLGVDMTELAAEFEAAGLTRRLAFAPKSCGGFAGVSMQLEPALDQPLRRMPEITSALQKLDVSDSVRKRSLQAFERLASVEAKVHGADPSQVHFHEVGAVDTLVDVVGVFWALEKLHVRSVTCGRLPWFGGTVCCEHGELPLPAPATTELYKGKPVTPSSACEELVTPTGALLVDQLVDDFGLGPQGVLQGCGLGFGARPGGGLRLFLFAEQGAGQRVERVWVLESNVDHLTGEELGAFFPALDEAGALDVLYTPGVMKKNRPGGVLQVMCSEADLERVQQAFFAHSLTLGLRRRREERMVLERQPATIRTAHGEAAAKRTVFQGDSYLRPEHEALRGLARATGLSVTQLRYRMYGEPEES